MSLKDAQVNLTLVCACSLVAPHVEVGLVSLYPSETPETVNIFLQLGSHFLFIFITDELPGQVPKRFLQILTSVTLMASARHILNDVT